MHIKSIEINNFRPFYGYNIFEFDYTNKKNINVISGKNGSGKSEFLNSIYWCLYGHEILEHSTQPLCNYNSINDATYDEEIKVSVICKFSYENKIWSIQREITFVKDKLSGNLININSDLRAFIDDTPISFIETFINHNFPKFSFSLFFDVENDELTSDNYIDNLKLFFYKLNNLDVIENVDNHLHSLLEKYSHDLSKLENLPRLPYLLDKRNSITEEIEKNNNDIQNKYDEISKLEDECLEIENRIRFSNFKDGGLNNLINDKHELENRMEMISHDIVKIRTERDKLIFKLFPIVVSLSGIKNMFNDEKLENMLLKNADFENTGFYKGYFNINYLFDKSQRVDDIKSYGDKEKFLEEKYSIMFLKHRELMSEIENSDDESFREGVSKLNILDENIKRLNKSITFLEEMKKNSTKELCKVEKEIDRFEKSNSPDFYKNFNFCKNLLNFGENLKFQLIEKQINNFSKILNYIFIDYFEMNTKFKKINVDKLYNISIIGNSNQVISIKDLSSTEKKLFKFSLMFTLNKIAYFKYPIVLMDPFLNLDSNKKDKLVNIILNKEFNNQILLIINENQYDEEIKDKFLKNNVIENKLIDYWRK